MTRTFRTPSFRRLANFCTEEYLPKIERCLEKLTDEQIWWRPNPESNSIGNLLLAPFRKRATVDRVWAGRGNGRARRQTEFDERRVIPRDELLALLRTTIADVDRRAGRF